MKRLIALLLCCALLFTMLPATASAAGEPEPDIWGKIAELEDGISAFRRAKDTENRMRAYASAVDEIAELVTDSDAYVPGSLIRNGEFLFWDQTDGTGCGYSPRLRAIMRENTLPDADPAAFSGTETTSFASRGGVPSSRNVAVIQPYYGIDTSFTNQYPNEGVSIAQATGGANTTYKVNDATIDNIAKAIENCGVVIFDSHGDTDYANGEDFTSRANTSYLCLQSGTGITSADQQYVQGPYGSYKHAYYAGASGSMRYYCVDGTAIANHMSGNSPNGLLWMAICLGMATDGMQAPMREKGVEVVYGYSQSVTFSGDFRWEEYFWSKMKAGTTVKDAIAYMKQKGGVKDPFEYQYPAYPIVVSSEDVYPGHGNVDKTQTVNSTWTLFAEYTVSAFANNDAWGTVSVSNKVITAKPYDGYYVDGAEIVSGNGALTRDGDSFTVTAEEDCSVRVDFAPKTPAVVHFSVPDGVSCSDLSGYLNEAVTLPAPEGEPTADAYHYRFMGWATAPLASDTAELPDFLRAGTRLTLTETESTYYAIYSYFVADNGMSDSQFTQVNAAPVSWAGDYVIAYAAEKALNADGTATGTNLGTSKGVVDLTELGCTLEDGTLNNVPDGLIFTMEPADNGSYTIKMRGSACYVALASDTNALTTMTSGTKNNACWTVTWDASKGAPVLTNVAYPNRSLQYNAAAHLFRCYNNGTQTPLTLYSAAEGTLWYTTSPGDQVPCAVHQFGPWEITLAASCVESGMQKRVCEVCGYTETEELSALGHAYTVTVTEPTCTEGGYSTYDCTRCGDHYVGDETAPLGHDYTVTVTEPTCTEGGYSTYDCTRCGDHYVGDETAPLGHDYTATVTEPSCTEGGYSTYECTRCGDHYVGDETAPLGHDYTVTVTEPTCTEPGRTALVCTRCGDQQIENETAPLGHDYTATVTEPTCTEPGRTALVCTRCGDQQIENETAPLGHDYTATVTEPTCTEPGFTAYDCTRCGDHYVVEGPDALGHDWDEGVVTLEPTTVREGTKTFTCLRCGETRTEALPKLVRDNPFVDVLEGKYYYDAVLWAYYHTPQITSGTDDTHFSPSKVCTREQVITFLWAAYNRPEHHMTSNPFTDVKQKYYYDAVMWAVENDITGGTSATTFGVGKSCTRAQVVTFLWKAAGSPEPSGTANPFTDVAETDYYYKAVLWAVESGVTGGTTPTTFSPKASCTRAQVVTFLYAALEKTR